MKKEIDWIACDAAVICGNNNSGSGGPHNGAKKNKTISNKF